MFAKSQTPKSQKLPFDLVDILAFRPELPKHIKAEIKNLIKTV